MIDAFSSYIGGRLIASPLKEKLIDDALEQLKKLKNLLKTSKTVDEEKNVKLNELTQKVDELTDLVLQKEKELEDLLTIVKGKDEELKALNAQLEDLLKEKTELTNVDTKKDDEIDRLSAIVMDKDVEIISQKTRMDLDYLDKLKKLFQTCDKLEKERLNLIQKVDDLTNLTAQKEDELNSLRTQLKDMIE